jgi:hypothetical protein
MRLRDMRRLVETDLRDLQKLLNRNPNTVRAELEKHISKNHAHTAGSELCRSLRLASLPLLGLVSYDSAGPGNWTERLPVRFKWSAAA